MYVRRIPPVSLARNLMRVLVLLLCGRAAWGMKNPCHPAAHKATPSYGCTKIVIPKGLCSQCDVGPITNRGHYLDCTRTTTSDTPECLGKFEEYLALNPCDTARRHAYDQYQSSDSFEKEDGRSKIDYYLYSICEQSCDCIPLQSTGIHRDIEIRRGNCQAHTRYDICKVLPNIKLIRGEGTPDDDVTNAPRACQGIADWWNSPDRDNWQNRQDHEVSPPIAYFLHRAIQASEMVTTNFWDSCFNLETSQDRISDNNDNWQVVQTDGIPDARHEGCFVWHEGLAYLIGGRKQPIVSEYNPRLRKWTNHSSTTAIDIHHSQCVSLNGKIWFPNAWYKGFPREENTEYLATYDPVTQVWDTTTHPALPLQRRRASGASVVYDGKIYTSHGNSGGHNTDAVVLSLLDVYDPSTKTWSSLPDGAYPRDHTGGAVVRDRDGNDLFCVAAGRQSVFGFPESYSGLVSQTECFNFGSSTWATLPDIPTLRAGASYGTTCDKKLMVAGGEIEGDGRNAPALSVVQVFDGHEWTDEPSLRQGRHGSGIAFDCSPCGEAYIASGNPTRGGGEDLTTTETFFREGISCERPLESPPTPSPRPPSFRMTTETPSASPTLASASPTLAPIVPVHRKIPAYTLYINCGPVNRPKSLDGLGRTWVSDRFFLGGYSSAGNSISSMSNLEASGLLNVYKRTRSAEQSFQYRIPKLIPGNYKVSLYFAETRAGGGAVGRRMFHVNMQQSRVLTDYDIFAATGTMYAAVVEEFVVVVGGEGTITIDFLRGKRSNPMVSGIAIESLFEAQPLPEKRYKANISCGGQGVLKDGKKRKWIPDDSFISRGKPFRPSFPKPVSGADATGMDPIYKTQRLNRLRLPYKFGDIPNGYYRVVLDFVEQVGTYSKVGKRMFNVDIQGTRELTDFDPYKAAGARHKVSRKVFYAVVDKNELSIILSQGSAGIPVISAIQLRQMPDGFVPAVKNPDVNSRFAVRVSIGSIAPIAVDGDRWLPDGKFMVSGRPAITRNTSTRAILSLPTSTNKEIMRTYRSAPNDWAVELPRLPPSKVTVRLHWAELQPNTITEGIRSFHVDIQGQRQLTDFDVYKEAGGVFVGVSREFPATVGQDGLLRIDILQGSAGDPFLSAVEVLSLGNGRRLSEDDDLSYLDPIYTDFSEEEAV